jgi:putative glutathione S-transferase
MSSAAEHKDGSTKWSSNDGRFRRQESSFRDEIAPGHASFQPQKGRYFLAAALACPWAHRCVGGVACCGAVHPVSCCSPARRAAL